MPVDKTAFNKSAKLLDQLLRANQKASFVKALRQQARQEGSEFKLEDSLLLYSSRLVISDIGLCTAVIREAYDQVFTTHSEKDKTYKLLWP